MAAYTARNRLRSEASLWKTLNRDGRRRERSGLTRRFFPFPFAGDCGANGLLTIGTGHNVEVANASGIIAKEAVEVQFATSSRAKFVTARLEGKLTRQTFLTQMTAIWTFSQHLKWLFSDDFEQPD